MNVSEIVQYMKLEGNDHTIQHIQTAHRIRIVDAARIGEGMRVLEIGCGQGDTTAVLAAKVGTTGFVKGIDIADGAYGAPITLGEATNHLLQGQLGQQMDIQLNTNLLDLSEEEQYDVAIFSHCSWYMDSVQTLEQLIQKASKLAKKIIIVDWDIIKVDTNQQAHQQAALIQALYATQETTDANIRTLFTRQQIEELCTRNGGEIEQSITIDAKELHDGEWEIAYASELAFAEPLESIANVMQELMETAALNESYSMDSFLVTAAMR